MNKMIKLVSMSFASVILLTACAGQTGAPTNTTTSFKSSVAEAAAITLPPLSMEQVKALKDMNKEAEFGVMKVLPVAPGAEEAVRALGIKTPAKIVMMAYSQEAEELMKAEAITRLTAAGYAEAEELIRRADTFALNDARAFVEVGEMARLAKLEMMREELAKEAMYPEMVEMLGAKELTSGAEMISMLALEKTGREEAISELQMVELGGLGKSVREAEEMLSDRIAAEALKEAEAGREARMAIIKRDALELSTAREVEMMERAMEALVGLKADTIAMEEREALNGGIGMLAKLPTGLDNIADMTSKSIVMKMAEAMIRPIAELVTIEAAEVETKAGTYAVPTSHAVQPTCTFFPCE